jgi:hypothetical protein
MPGSRGWLDAAPPEQQRQTKPDETERRLGMLREPKFVIVGGSQEVA